MAAIGLRTKMIDVLWVVIAFFVGGMAGMLLAALMVMSGRSDPPRRRPPPDPIEWMPMRDDGTRAVNTVAQFVVTDEITAAPSWPLDNAHVKYKAYP